MSPSSRAAAPDRIRLAVDLVDPRPGDRILEVGSGDGASIALLLEREPRLTIVSLDRSPAATGRIAARHVVGVADGRVVLRTGSLHDFRLERGDAPFDSIFAVDVNVFWTASAQTEVAAVRDALEPGGALILVYGAPAPGMAERDVAPVIERKLRTAGFGEVSSTRGSSGTAIRGIR